MDIFDKVKNELVEASREMQDRAKDVQEALKLQKEMKEKESYIRKIYEELGQKYYDEHKDDSNADFEDLEAAIARVEELKEQIADIKGTTTCPQCGAKIPSTAAYCSKCGAKADPEVIKVADPEVVEEK